MLSASDGGQALDSDMLWSRSIRLREGRGGMSCLFLSVMAVRAAVISSVSIDDRYRRTLH